MFCGAVMTTVQLLYSVWNTYFIQMEMKPVLLSIAVGVLFPVCLLALKYYKQRNWNLSTLWNRFQFPSIRIPSVTTTSALDISSDDLSHLLGGEVSSSQLEITEIYEEPTTPSSMPSSMTTMSTTNSDDPVTEAVADADIESSIVNELELEPGHNDSQNTTKDAVSEREHFERLKSVEQELSNQKLLNKFTNLRLTQKETECVELSKSDKMARSKIRELMMEIASISKKNADLMSYCESKVAQCRAEYDKMSGNTFALKQEKRRLEVEVAGLRKKCSENTLYRNECTKLRATISTLRSQIKESGEAMNGIKRENKGLRAQIETQRQRLNESSKSITKLNADLANTKLESRRLKSTVSSYKERISEMEVDQEDLTMENQDIKQQIQRFSKQLENQSLIQSEIIGLQQTLNKEAKRSIPSPTKSVRSIPSPTKTTRRYIPSPTKSIRSIRSMSSPMDSQKNVFPIYGNQVAIENAEEDAVTHKSSASLISSDGFDENKRMRNGADIYGTKREQPLAHGHEI